MFRRKPIKHFFERRAAGRFVPYAIAVMIYLAALVVTGAMGTAGAIFGPSALEFSPGHWLALAGLVPGVTLIAMATARTTVLRALARIP